MFNGYEIWKPDVENCAKYRITNLRGLLCGRCMKICPLNKVVSKDGSLLVRIASWLGINAMWLKPILFPFAVWFDDFIGNGTRVKSQKWWLDLEYVDEKLVKARKVSQRDNNPKKKPFKNQRIAIYPPEDLPPGDSKECHPVDRHAALVKGDEAVKPESHPSVAP